MLVQHAGYAGVTLALPFSRNPETGKLESVTADARGIVEVPDRDGQWLVSTPGWRELLVPAQAPVAASEPAKPVLVPVESTEVELNGLGDKEPGLGEEIDALKSKADALAFAELHEVSTLTDGMLLRDMKEALKTALLAPQAPDADAGPAAAATEETK